jgi:hypothetical protein
MSVNSFASGYGAESQLESEISDIYTAVSSMDLGRSVSFPTGNKTFDGCYEDQQGNLGAATSFETACSRFNDIGVPSAVLSNLVEGKTFSPKIKLAPSVGVDRQSFDFAGLPATPAMQRSSFCEDTLSNLLHHQSVTPSTMQTLSVPPDEFQTSEVAHFHVPDLDRSSVDQFSSHGSNVPNFVAESVLSYPDLHVNCPKLDNPTSPPKGEDVNNYADSWTENEENELSKIEKDLNNLLMSDNGGKGKEDSYPTYTLESGWNQFTRSTLSPNRPFTQVVPENFNDDDVESVVTPDRRKLGESSRISPLKSPGKRRNTSRWNFLNL